jgi:hypothetical protein
MNKALTNQEIDRILWNPEFHYRIHRSPLPAPILSKINPVHAPISLLEIHFNVMLSSTPRSST